MRNALLKTTDQLELELYYIARKYHGFFEDIAEQTVGRPAALRQAMNPDYHERPSFITRTAVVFVAKGKAAIRTSRPRYKSKGYQPSARSGRKGT